MIDLTAFVKTLNDRPIAVFGLGASGLASIKALTHHGARVIAWDDNQTARDEAKELGATITPLDQSTLSTCACLLLAPGVPLTHPTPHDVVVAAQAAGVEIIGDLEILHRANHGHKTIGITGTNGKSTTTALLTHVLNNVLNACGHDAVMGGNIGAPVLTLDLRPDTILVLEVSSYQIDLCPTFRPDIGVLLNITPDHIDRHGTFENYAVIKTQFISQSHHVIDVQDFRPPAGDFPNLAGAHNAQNIAAVLAVCTQIGIDIADAIAAVKTFPGLAHRQYLVREINGVKYINDSKATNAIAAQTALCAYDHIHWIVGGRAKDGGLDGLQDNMSAVKHAYLIGEATDDFAAWMDNNGVAYTRCHTLDNAVHQAHANTTKNGEQACILLSPACASFDQFKSFEARGDAFVKYVEELTA